MKKRLATPFLLIAYAALEVATKIDPFWGKGCTNSGHVRAGDSLQNNAVQVIKGSLNERR